jgi:hypothetical protein
MDGADYVLCRKTGGNPAGYNTWRTNFGATLGSGSSVTAAPTPVFCHPRADQRIAVLIIRSHWAVEAAPGSPTVAHGSGTGGRSEDI